MTSMPFLKFTTVMTLADTLNPCSRFYPSLRTHAQLEDHCSIPSRVRDPLEHLVQR